jgi:GT2 family glycosyltransferase
VPASNCHAEPHRLRAEAMNIPELSVVIVNYNTSGLLKQCLQSLTSTKGSLALEIIVVDNASNDDSVSICEELFPEVRIIRNDTNVGFGRANNQGISVSNGGFVLLLNSDTTLLHSSLEMMLRPVSQHSTIGVVGCRLLDADGSSQPSCMKFPNLRLVLIQELMLYKLSKRFPRPFFEPPYLDVAKDCDWVFGTAMLIRKKALEASGLFDPNIWMYSEEMELCYRIRGAGWRVLFDPGAKVIHLGEGPKFLKMRGLLYFFKKHFSSPTYFAVYSMVAAGAALRVFLWSVWIALNIVRGRGIGHGIIEARSNWALIVKLLRPLAPFLNGVTGGGKVTQESQTMGK